MKPEEEFEKWLQDNATLYKGDNAIDCMKAAAMHFLAIGRKQGIESLGHCTCTMSQKLTGDGCSVCNPTLKREIECYNEGYKDGIEEAAEVLNEVWRLCSKIVNSSPDTPIKGEIESMAYMLAHHPLVINKDSIFKLNEKV